MGEARIPTVPLASDARISAIYELADMQARYRVVQAAGQWRVADKVGGGLVEQRYDTMDLAESACRLLVAQDILDKFAPRVTP